MYQNIVVGVDGRAAGRDAIALADKLAAPDAHVTLVNVRVLEAPVAPGYGAPLASATKPESLQLLDAERARAHRAVETVSVLGSSVAAGLHDAAESRGADMLVIGSCHRSAAGRILAGDDTRATLHQAPCAVAVAPNGYAEIAREPHIVGVAYDGSAQSDVALQYARELAQRTGARLAACHVASLRVYGAGAWAVPIADDVTEEAARELREHSGLTEGELTVLVGVGGEELAAFSETVDVLVCGSRHNGIVRRAVLGSTSDHLARHCACPLIVTPAAVEQPAAASSPAAVA